jgi:hypothetical protein
MTASEILIVGANILGSVLIPEGFVFHPSASASSSGGKFASGVFARPDRSLEVHFRHSLGLAAYRIGEVILAHREYVRAVRAIDQVATASAYPCFSDDPAEQFRALHHDLLCFGQRFLRGSVDGFGELQSWLAKNPRPTGFDAL